MNKYEFIHAKEVLAKLDSKSLFELGILYYTVRNPPDMEYFINLPRAWYSGQNPSKKVAGFA